MLQQGKQPRDFEKMVSNALNGLGNTPNAIKFAFVRMVQTQVIDVFPSGLASHVTPGGEMDPARAIWLGGGIYEKQQQRDIQTRNYQQFCEERRIDIEKLFNLAGQEVELINSPPLQDFIDDVKLWAADDSPSCVHQKRRSQCIECDGSAICKHKKQRARCIECDGSAICVHQKRQAICIECNGSALCVHKKRRARCIECDGSAICVHQKHRAQCIECNGSAICVHKKRQATCIECDGSAICKHKKRRAQCIECDGSALYVCSCFEYHIYYFFLYPDLFIEIFFVCVFASTQTKILLTHNFLL